MVETIPPSYHSEKSIHHFSSHSLNTQTRPPHQQPALQQIHRTPPPLHPLKGREFRTRMSKVSIPKASILRKSPTKLLRTVAFVRGTVRDKQREAVVENRWAVEMLLEAAVRLRILLFA